jgi:hypothetical protein
MAGGRAHQAQVGQHILQGLCQQDDQIDEAANEDICQQEGQQNETRAQGKAGDSRALQGT